MQPLRFSVVGNSGSGKSTLSRRLAAQLGAPLLELDALKHGPRWTPLATEPFAAQVGRFCEGERWVVDGNYAEVQPLVWARAQAVLWLALPRRTVMRQLVARTLRRTVLRTELWNGNREQWHFMLRGDHPIRWAWSTYSRRQRDFERLMDARWVRLRSRHDVQRWLEAMSPAV